MLTFFRRIRKVLFDKGQVSRYLIYAIGEIALVVIGILIALQINNWNEGRKSRVLEKEILQQLRSELNADIETIHANINRIDTALRRSERITYHLKNSQDYPDPLYADFNIISLGFSFNFNSTAIKTLESNGIEIITNQNLRNQIIELYSRWYPWIEGIHDNYISNLKLVFRPLLRKNFIYLELSSGLEPVNFVELKDNIEFSNAIKVARSNYTAMLERYEIAAKAARSIVLEIEEEYP